MKERAFKAAASGVVICGIFTLLCAALSSIAPIVLTISFMLIALLASIYGTLAWVRYRRLLAAETEQAYLEMRRENNPTFAAFIRQ